MLNVTFDINENHTRPVFKLFNVNALLDPGAELPIFGVSDRAIISMFDGVKVSEEISISGFGGKGVSKFSLYILKHFELGKMTYKNIPIAVGDTASVSVDIVLGATMFGAGTVCVIDTAKDTVSILTYSDMPRNPNKGRSKVEDTVIKIMSLEEEIKKDMDQLVNLKQDIIRRIRAVEEPELQTILDLRYLAYMRWEEIAIELGYGIDNVYHLHRKA